MIKRMLGWILEGLTGLFANEVSTRDIRAYIEKYYQRLKARKKLDETIAKDLDSLEKSMQALGWLESRQKENETGLKLDLDASEANTSFPVADWFSREGLVPGAGKTLEKLNSQTRRQEVVSLLEKILRHVEVKREKSLRKFTRKITFEQEWLERLDISILFSRTARRHHDLRFLNAALKMNGWYFTQIRFFHSDVVTARFLLSLAEVEISAQELLT